MLHKKMGGMMMEKAYVCFENKREIIRGGESNSIGNLMFKFLYADFDTQKTKVYNTQEKIKEIKPHENSILTLDNPDEKPYFLFASTYQNLISKLEGISPVFGYCFDIYMERVLDKSYREEMVAPVFTHNLFRHFPSKKMDVDVVSAHVGNSDALLFEATEIFIDGVLHYLGDLMKFQSALLSMIEKTIDIDGSNNDLTPSQRFYFQRLIGNEYIWEYSRLHNKLRIDYKLLSGADFDWDNDEDLIQTIKKLNLQPKYFYSAEDLRALIYMEFEYMCTNDIYVKKCEYCGYYFLPYSKDSLFCDRLVRGTDKTCKQIAHNEKQKVAISKDKAKKLYNRLSNNYSMSLRRGNYKMTEELLNEWRFYAKCLKDRFYEGLLSFEDLEYLMDMETWLGDREFSERRAGIEKP